MPGMTQAPQSEADLHETLQSLKIILSDTVSFEKVVTSVFAGIDADSNNTLTLAELQNFLGGISGTMNLPAPEPAQVQGVFRQLDLNGDRGISRDELSVFLRHLFQEQVKFCQSRLHLQP